jgi:hypothetical protein
MAYFKSGRMFGKELWIGKLCRSVGNCCHMKRIIEFEKIN